MTPEIRPNQNLFELNADILKAMAHPVRLMIIDELLKNPRCVTAIHEILDVRQPNISQHLTILKNAGIVASDRDGAYICYYLRKPSLIMALMKALEGSWPEAKIDDVRGKFRKALSVRLGKQGK
jgi:DNA-binding transcriptional ArsR family regulator